MSQSSAITASQTAATVLRAELGRRLADRRRCSRLAALTALSVLCGSGVLAFVHEFTPEGQGTSVETLPTALEMTAAAAAILLGLHTLAVAAAETNDGTVVTSLLLVPRRGRLLLMRAASAVVVATTAGIMTLMLVLGIGLATRASGWTTLSLIATLAAGTGAIILTCLLGFFTGTALRSGVAGMLVAMLGLVVVPLSIGVLQLAAPSSLAGVLNALLLATPGAGVAQTVSVQRPTPDALPPTVLGLTTLVAWNSLVALLALHQFRREGLSA